MFGSDGRVSVGMGLSRLRKQDKERRIKEEQESVYRSERLAETYVRFLMRGLYKYRV